MSLLPKRETPRVTRLRGPRELERLDALLVVCPETENAALLESLPQPAAWRHLHGLARPRAGTVRSGALPTPQHTRAVLGYLGAEAGAFERLTLAGRMFREIASQPIERVGLVAPGDAPSAELALEALLAAALAHACAMPEFRAPQRERKRLREIVLAGAKPLDLSRCTAAAAGTNLARWLTALPPNRLDARAYRRAIGELAARHGLEMRWLDERALRRLGAQAFLAVSAGNAERTAGIAHLKYRPGARRGRSHPDVALVGKGILFDTGGTNLKPHKAMLDMHTDMAGSAVALATLVALAELRAPLAADAWLAITENRIGPTAYRPQDVVRAANGVTIQVVHTDAEGRMVLADTLALAGRTRPRLMLDFATLTGACVHALTERMSGVFTNRPGLVETLLEAGRTSGERVWHFPLAEDYDSDIESKVADVLQCAVEGKGDHILAARFLWRFVPKETAWAHFDLASATRSGGLAHIATDVTGFGVRYALELLLGQRVLDRLEGQA